MVNIILDGKPLEVEDGLTILQAAEQAGLHIPHLCYHPAFAPEGSCRLCAVEIEGLPKLELACATVVREGMKVSTDSRLVAEARRSVLEFLLTEHPLDCPICDKAGDCKLQDYYEAYGLFPGRFSETKNRKDKKVPLGRTLLLDRERCVFCTRCVRFLGEVTRTAELGVFERGARSEVGLYEGRPVDNNYSGCLAEICPVGAITDADFRFKTRSWLLRKGESLCPLCSRGCNIQVEFHPGFARLPGTRKVFRLRAKANERVNGPWICDLGRYGYGYLQQERCLAISGPAAKRLGLGTVEETLDFLVPKLKKAHFMKRQARLAVVVSDWLTNEEFFLARAVFSRDLPGCRLYLCGPADGQADGFLLTAERSPNRRGAKEIGFSPNHFRLEDLGRETDILIVFGPFLAERFTLPEVKTALSAVETKVLFTPQRNGLESVFDFVVPTAHPAEKDGSFTNIDGLVQSFAAALEPQEAARAEWEILSGLGRRLGLNARFYQSFAGAPAVLAELRKEFPFFA
ncbi:MAG TPA: 2Fe-2S iron-sulfur cluster-binding protein [Acidobacteriota bacterium]